MVPPRCVYVREPGAVGTIRVAKVRCIDPQDSRCNKTPIYRIFIVRNQRGETVSGEQQEGGLCAKVRCRKYFSVRDPPSCKFDPAAFVNSRRVVSAEPAVYSSRHTANRLGLDWTRALSHDDASALHRRHLLKCTLRAGIVMQLGGMHLRLRHRQPPCPGCP
eukprot:scaffold89601_cov60-Phaeocystis_antarctica.AAC.1